MSTIKTRYLSLWSHIAWTLIEWNPFLFTKSLSKALGPWIRTWVPSMQPITPGKPPFSKKPRFISCLSAAVDGHRMNSCCFRTRAVDTLLTILETVHLGMPPTVSPTTSKKLPLAKKRRATRTCSWGFNARFLPVGLSRSAASVSVMNWIELRENL